VLPLPYFWWQAAQALQAVSISAGLPQSVLLLLACVGLVKTLRVESLSCCYK
jgi:choline-glycine betaine transporter